MSLEEPTSPKKRARWKQRSFAPVCVTINEFMAATGISRPVLYRMMSADELRYVQFGKRMRRIPVGEFVRLGFDPPTT
jgi:hypothetical protein